MDYDHYYKAWISHYRYHQSQIYIIILKYSATLTSLKTKSMLLNIFPTKAIHLKDECILQDA